MTKICQDTQTCCMCGAEVTCRVLLSTNAFGSPDLDLRPPPMQRSTMDVWLQECSACGFVNNDLSDPMPLAAERMSSERYTLLNTDNDIPETARKFEKFALLQADDLEAVGLSLLRAAWCCDDAERKQLAFAYRQRSAQALAQLLPVPDKDDDVNVAFVLVDVLRRSAQFAKADALIGSLSDYLSVQGNKTLTSVLTYQQRLCQAKDVRCYMVSACAETR